jgi:hypothetical protein
MNSSATIVNFRKVLIFNLLFLKLNQFICTSGCSVHCYSFQCGHALTIPDSRKTTTVSILHSNSRYIQIYKLLRFMADTLPHSHIHCGDVKFPHSVMCAHSQGGEVSLKMQCKPNFLFGNTCTEILVFVTELHSDSTSNDIFSLKQKSTACNLLPITTSSEKVMLF